MSEFPLKGRLTTEATPSEETRNATKYDRLPKATLGGLGPESSSRRCAKGLVYARSKLKAQKLLGDDTHLRIERPVWKGRITCLSNTLFSFPQICHTRSGRELGGAPRFS